MKFTFLSRIAGLVILSLVILFISYTPAQAGSPGTQYWLQIYALGGGGDGYDFLWPVTDPISGAPSIWLTDGEYGKVSKAFDGVDYAETDMRNNYLKGGSSLAEEPGSVPGCFVKAAQLKNHTLWNFMPGNDPSEVPGCVVFAYVMPDELASWSLAFANMKSVQDFLQGKMDQGPKSAVKNRWSGRQG